MGGCFTSLQVNSLCLTLTIYSGKSKHEFVKLQKHADFFEGNTGWKTNISYVFYINEILVI